MSLDTAYRLLPLPFGDWAFWLPFPGMSLLLLALAVLVLTVVAALLHRRRRFNLHRNLVLLCVPLWAGFLLLFNAREWLYWTLGWFYSLLLVTIIIAFLHRNALPYILAVLFAALLQHQGSVLMVLALART